MPTKFNLNDEVLVPIARLDPDRESVSAFVRTKVIGFPAGAPRKVTVDLVNGGGTADVPKSTVYKNIGVCIFAIGDFATEPTLIEPMRKSVLQYFRLLLPSPSVVCHSVRSKDEVRKLWSRDHSICSHVVIIGHGSRNCVEFAVDGEVSPEDFGALFAQPLAGRKHFVSLCCRTGLKSFATGFIQASKALSMIAPFHSIHGAVGSQFLQTFFGHHFISGKTAQVAFSKASVDIPGRVKFRYWTPDGLK